MIRLGSYCQFGLGLSLGSVDSGQTGSTQSTLVNRSQHSQSQSRRITVTSVRVSSVWCGSMSNVVQSTWSD
ncbi:hypothetical protein HanPSC8_Chr06g0264811 [Helianthus annuus]|nr:hypothetical protein HanPSC8_Chr06g0264811 [Helianthus annuus]